MHFPKTALEFEERFNDEAACEEYLFTLRWPNGFVCPKCGHEGGWRLRSRPRLIECSGCHAQTSLTAGTAFHGTRKPLRAWFKAMFLMATQKTGTSAMNVRRQVGLNYETAWTWLHKLRAALSSDHRTRLRGCVETDEGFIGGEEPGVPGRGSKKKALVSVAVEVREKRLGRARMTVIPDASQATLTPLVTGNVELASEVHTDGWAGYDKLDEHGVRHRVHKGKERGKAAAKRLPHVHLVISLLQRFLLGTYQGAVQARHLQSYLNEFVFRFNRRGCRFATGIFERLARAVARVPTDSRATYASIVKLRHATPLRVAA